MTSGLRNTSEGGAVHSDSDSALPAEETTPTTAEYARGRRVPPDSPL